MAKWNVSNIEVKDIDELKNVIVKALFEVSEHDQGRNAFLSGEIHLLPPNAATFTELGFVQLEQAVSWVDQKDHRRSAHSKARSGAAVGTEVGTAGSEAITE
jgi:hypothetical protein